MKLWWPKSEISRKAFRTEQMSFGRFHTKFNKVHDIRKKSILDAKATAWVFKAQPLNRGDTV